MTMRAILGLVGLNGWLFAVGACLLWGLRGFSSWGDVGRLCGLAYMVGVAAMGTLWTWQLVVGIDLTLAAVFVGGFVLAAVGIALGVAFHRPLPPRGGLRFRAPSVTTAVGAALTVVFFEALFRSGRLAGLYEFDAWSFWVPKAKAIYYFGGLDHQFFSELPGQSYPPVVPALEAAAFRFMGGADVVTLHLQFWFLLLGFVAALVGLLSPRVRPLFLWPSLLLVLVTPHVVGYSLRPEGDFLLDELFALACVLMALWLVDREPWQLIVAALLGAGAILTKREGYVIVACLFVAAFVAGTRDARFVWPRIALAGVAALAAAVPWRVLLAVRGLSGGGPEAGGTGLFANFDRFWPSLRLALGTVFDFNIWLVVVPVFLIALLAAFACHDRELPVFAAVLFVLCVAALTWSTWAFPSLPITKEAALNPIVRFSGALVLAAAALVPLLVARTGEAAPR
jgi:hypothetical protein